MANRLQIQIYNLCNAVPWLIVWAAVYYCQFKTLLLPTVLVALTLLLIIMFILCFKYTENNLETIEINASAVTSIDKELFINVSNLCSFALCFIMDDIDGLILVCIIIFGSSSTLVGNRNDE